MDPVLIGTIASAGGTIIGSVLLFVSRRFSTQEKSKSQKNSDDLERFRTLLSEQRTDLDRERVESARLRTELASERDDKERTEDENEKLHREVSELTRKTDLLKSHAELVERDLLGRAQDAPQQIGLGTVEPRPIPRAIGPGTPRESPPQSDRES